MANYPKYTLTGKTPATTYESLVQYNSESSSLVNGDGDDLPMILVSGSVGINRDGAAYPLDVNDSIGNSAYGNKNYIQLDDGSGSMFFNAGAGGHTFLSFNPEISASSLGRDLIPTEPNTLIIGGIHQDVVFTGSVNSNGGFTGSLFGTASYVLNGGGTASVQEPIYLSNAGNFYTTTGVGVGDVLLSFHDVTVGDSGSAFIGIGSGHPSGGDRCLTELFADVDGNFAGIYFQNLQSAVFHTIKLNTTDGLVFTNASSNSATINLNGQANFNSVTGTFIGNLEGTASVATNLASTAGLTTSVYLTASVTTMSFVNGLLQSVS